MSEKEAVKKYRQAIDTDVSTTNGMCEYHRKRFGAPGVDCPYCVSEGVGKRIDLLED